ncbi:MAG: hypothetical protein SGILL_001633 [Bacillariaceae sp.]
MITGRVPSRQMESLISSLVKIPNMIDADDKAHYEKRLKQETPRPYQVRIYKYACCEGTGGSL